MLQRLEKVFRSFYSLQHLHADSLNVRSFLIPFKVYRFAKYGLSVFRQAKVQNVDFRG